MPDAPLYGRNVEPGRERRVETVIQGPVAVIYHVIIPRFALDAAVVFDEVVDATYVWIEGSICALNHPVYG